MASFLFPLGRASLLKQLATLLAGCICIPPTHSSAHSNLASSRHHCRATTYLMRNSMQASLIVSFYLSRALNWAPVTKPSAMCQAIMVFLLLWYILFCFLSLLCWLLLPKQDECWVLYGYISDSLLFFFCTRILGNLSHSPSFKNHPYADDSQIHVSNFSLSMELWPVHSACLGVL